MAFNEPRPTKDTFTQDVQESLQGGDLSKYDNSIPRDAFDTAFARQLLRFSRGKNRLRASVFGRNRKYRGHTPKEEEIATLRIVSNLSASSRETSANKQKSGAFVIFGTDQFLLQSATEQDVERYQIVETFGEPVAFFFGRRPRIYTYSGTLFNSGFRFNGAGNNFFEDSTEFQVNSMLWRDNFKLAYELFLRGTKCVKFRARAYLNYDRVLREGFILNNQIIQNIHPNMVQFSFSMFITREVNLDGVEALQKNTLEGSSAPAKPADATIAALRQKIESGKDIIGRTSRSS